MSKLSRTLASSILLFGAALFVDLGCRQATGDEESFPTAAVEADETARGTYKVISREDDEASDAEMKAMKLSTGPKHRIIYLNGKGGTYTPGTNDSSTNHSSIPKFTATIPPYEK